MDIFGENREDEEEPLESISPLPNRGAKVFFSDPTASVGGRAINCGGESVDEEGFDLNSSAQDFPNFRSYSEILASPTFPNISGMEVAAGRRGSGISRSARGGRGGAARLTGSGADVSLVTGKPFPSPRMATGGTRGGRGTPRRAAAAAARCSSSTPRMSVTAGCNGGPRFCAEVEGDCGLSCPAEEEFIAQDEDEALRDRSLEADTTGEVDETFYLARKQMEVMQQYGVVASIFGTYYHDTFMNKAQMRDPQLSGYDWVMGTLNNPTACFNMFRMSAQLFAKLHELLVSSYGLTSSNRMSSIEALAMFLWIIGAPQSMRQAENCFERSTETISRKFEEVLNSIHKLSADIIKPKDPEFRTVHPRLQGPMFSPYFDNCIGAIDGTHIPVVVPVSKMLQHMGRYGYTTQNVLAVCDFDMRFTFAVAGWPGSVHDMRVFSDTVRKYGDKFPHPPPGKFYLVDSGYPNRPGYLAPYRGTKYHLPEFRQGPRPSGKKGGVQFCTLISS